MVERTPTAAVRWLGMEGRKMNSCCAKKNSPWKKKSRPFSDPTTEGVSHGSPTSVEVEGTSVTRNGEEMGGEQPDLELRSRAVNNGGNGSSSPRDFNLDEFLTLAHKARFGIEKSRLPAESLNVDEHPFARELKQQREPDLAGGFAQQQRENQISPATVGISTKDDVRNVADMDASVDNVGADVAGNVSDMEACLEHTADISPSRADIIAAARADIITDARADIIAAARADIIAAARADIIAAPRADDTGASRADVSNYTIKFRADIINDTRKARADISAGTCKNRADVSNSVERKQAMHDAPVPTGLYVGNIPLHAYPETIIDDKIAHAFKSFDPRKTLSFIAPTMQNGEVVVRPSLDAVRNGSKRWKSTAVGYFLGKRPYYHHLKEFAHSVWPALREVTATTNGFFFFQFKTVFDMEEIIEGGPWLFQRAADSTSKVGTGDGHEKVEAYTSARLD
ncbi:UNVERIFIED_CONTAM: hypothetical protein Sindi_3033100 [Sesamum indicum]